MYEMDPAYSVTAINTNIKSLKFKDLINIHICN